MDPVSVEHELQTFEEDVGALRKELLRLAALRGGSYVWVRMNMSNKVPLVNISHVGLDELSCQDEFVVSGSGERVRREGLWSTHRFMAEEIYNVIRAWHEAHPFCRVNAQYGDMHPTRPWPPAVWRTAWSALVAIKKSEKNKRGETNEKTERGYDRSTKKQRVDDKKYSTVVELCAKHSHCVHARHGAACTAEVITSPSEGSFKVCVHDSSTPEEQIFRVGDRCTSEYDLHWNNAATSSYIEGVVEKVTKNCIFVEQKRYGVIKHKRIRPDEVAALVLRMELVVPTETYKSAVRTAVLDETNLDTIASTLTADPSKLPHLLTVLENSNTDDLVPGEAIFDALNAAHIGATPHQRGRIDTLIAKLSLPTAMRMKASHAVATEEGCV